MALAELLALVLVAPGRTVDVSVPRQLAFNVSLDAM